LSLSDVIVLQKKGEIFSHYCDSFGFKELSHFTGTEKAAELDFSGGLVREARPVKFENVDLLEYLGKIMETNTFYYKSDLKIDAENIRRAAESPEPGDKHLFWYSYPSGTHSGNERRLFLKTAQSTITGSVMNTVPTPELRRMRWKFQKSTIQGQQLAIYISWIIKNMLNLSMKTLFNLTKPKKSLGREL
jgi:hypothetical protein